VSSFTPYRARQDGRRRAGGRNFHLEALGRMFVCKHEVDLHPSGKKNYKN
jgi:hypothetical protein